MLLQIYKDVKYLANTLKTYLISIKTRVFKIKLDQLIKDTCGRVSRLGSQLAGIVRFN